MGMRESPRNWSRDRMLYVIAFTVRNCLLAIAPTN